MRLAYAALAAAQLTTIPAACRAAEPLFVVLDYEISPTLKGCPDLAAFRQLVIGQVGYDPFRSAAAQRVTARAIATKRGIDGSVEWTDNKGQWQGERRFSSRKRVCAELMAGMSFAIAVQLELLNSEQLRVLSDADGPAKAASAAPPGPDKQGSHEATSGPMPPTLRNADAGASVTKPAGSSAKSQRAAWSALAGFGAFAGLGLAPTVAAHGRLFAALRYGFTSLELGGEAGWPSNSRQRYGSGFREYSIAAGLAACGHGQRIAVCGLAKVGQIRVHGFGVDDAGAAAGLIVQVGLRLAFALRVGDQLSLLPRVEGLYAPTHWAVELNQTPVYTTPRISGLLGVDLALRFP